MNLGIASKNNIKIWIKMGYNKISYKYLFEIYYIKFLLFRPKSFSN